MAAAHLLARWAADLRPTSEDLALAHRSLLDTMAVILAARDEPVTTISRGLAEGARWAVTGHVLDFDDLHMQSTAHVSVVCVPTSLALGGGPRAYLAAAGVMARLGSALGWKHYSAGWHATCTAGAPASAAGAAVALGLSVREVANAIALAIPGRAAFSVRSVRTPSRSRSASPSSLVSAPPVWLQRAPRRICLSLMRGYRWLEALRPRSIFPAPRCQADSLSKSTHAATRCSGPSARFRSSLVLSFARRRSAGLSSGRVNPPSYRLHHQPDSGLQGKFSLEYAAAAALLDRYPGFTSFTDAAVRREPPGSLPGRSR